jgi:hypothetical protein
MNRGLRDAIRIAQTEGLSLIEVNHGTRHSLLVLKNGLGQMMRQPISKGAAMAGQDLYNMRANFRRFARGDDHGLHILH